MEPLPFIDEETEAQGRTCLPGHSWGQWGTGSGTQISWCTVWPLGCAVPLLGWSIWMGSPNRPEPYTSLCSPWEETGPSQDRDQGATCS